MTTAFFVPYDEYQHGINVVEIPLHDKLDDYE